MEEQIKEFAFLKKSSHKDLKKLADCLIFGVGNTGIHKKARLADELSKTQAYKEHQKDSLQNAVDVIIDEFLRCGGSTIMNKKRDGGVPYIEILRDICDRLYIYWHDDMPVTMIEKNLIIYVMERCLISNPQIVNDLYSKWCEELIIYQSNELSQEFKMDCIMDFSLAKSNLIKTMAFIINELDKMVNTKAKDYNGWLKEIYKQVNSPSARTPLGVANKALHYFNPIALQGAAYDVTFPATLYIIYMRNKKVIEEKFKFKVGDKINLIGRSDEEYNILTITSVIEEKKCYTCNQSSIIHFEDEDKWRKVK